MAYSRGAVERAMKAQEVILRAIDGKLTWVQAADILGYSPRTIRRIRWRQLPSPKRAPVADVQRLLALSRERYLASTRSCRPSAAARSMWWCARNSTGSPDRSDTSSHSAKSSGVLGVELVVLARPGRRYDDGTRPGAVRDARRLRGVRAGPHPRASDRRLTAREGTGPPSGRASTSWIRSGLGPCSRKD